MNNTFSLATHAPGLCASRESITQVLRDWQNRFSQKRINKKTRLFCSVLRNINPGLDVRAKEGYREGEEENQECFSLSSVFGQTCHMLFFPRSI